MTEKDNKTRQPASYLIAECGNTHSNVLLFDVIANSYRLVGYASAPTTLVAPYANIMEGIVEAISRLATATGRKLLNGKKLITPARDAAGVDHFVFIVSAAAPLKTILVGLSEEVSLSSARQVLHTVYANEVDAFSLTDSRSEEEQVAAIIAHKPDLIFLTGGTDGGSDQRLAKFAHTASLGANMLLGAKQVHVLYAGNTNLRPTIKDIMGEHIPLHTAANVRPTLQTEQLDDAAQAIGDLYESLKIKELPGVHVIQEWSEFAPLPTSRAFAGIVQYFATLQKRGQRVVGLEVGTESVTLVNATAETVDLNIRSDLGTGRGLPNLLQHTTTANIARWLPIEIGEDEIRDFIYNKSLHPQTVAISERDLYLEQAIAREMIRVAAQSMSPGKAKSMPLTAALRLLLVRGVGLANMPRPGQIIAILLDALQPTGIFGVALDEYDVLPALGALSALEPLAAVQALESKVLADLGWVVAPKGKGKPGQKVLHVSIEAEQQPAQYTGDVAFGSLELFVLGQGRSKITLKPERRFDIGLGPGKGTTIYLPESRVGLVVDARGRPLVLPQEEPERRTLMQQWYFDMGG